MNHAVRLERVSLADFALLQKLYVETMTEAFNFHENFKKFKQSLDQTYSLQRLKTELTDLQTSFFVLRDEDRVIGYIKLNVEDAQTEQMTAHSLEIQRIYIRKEFQRQGYGSYLLHMVETIARQMDKKLIWLSIWEKNFPALKFYHQLGYQAASYHTFAAGEDQRTDFILTKEIQ